MSIKIKYINKINKNDKLNYTLFVNEKFELSSIKQFLNQDEIKYINLLIKNKNIKKNFLYFDLNEKKSVILIKKNLEISEENLGAEFCSFIKENNFKNVTLFGNNFVNFTKDFLYKFLHGLKLKSYKFNLYKSKKEDNKILINIF